MFPAQAPRVCGLRGVPSPIDPISDEGFVRVRSEARAEVERELAVNKVYKVERSQTRELVLPERSWSLSAGWLCLPAGTGIQPAIPAG